MRTFNYSLIFVIFLIGIWGCEKSDGEDLIVTEKTNSRNVRNETNYPFRPMILGAKKENPYSVKNMQAALDSLKAHPGELSGCLRSPQMANEIEIKATDLYVRFLPEDTIQYKTLMSDTTLTLFDHPIDYEIAQSGDYYFDPSVQGDFTWYYTRVPVGYTPPEGIRYEILTDLFLYEHSEYYSEEIINDTTSAINNVGRMKVTQALNACDALKTIETISFFNTGNGKEIIKENNANTPAGMQRLRKAVNKQFLWYKWVEYEYFPSGIIKAKSYFNMDKNGNFNNYAIATDIPLKGVKIFLWNWFKWNSVYTNEAGYYESPVYYNEYPLYYIVFDGYNGSNSWVFDRVILGAVCLWSQKHYMGQHSYDGYSTTITQDCGAWDACVANNAFYDYMTICDKEGLTRPPASLKVALREMSGSSAAPLLQNHINTYAAAFFSGLAVQSSLSATGIPVFDVAALALALKLAAPDVILSGGNIEENRTTWTEDIAFKDFYATVWHELSHCSNLQRVKNEKGNALTNAFWSKLVATEVATMLVGKGYGQKGDNNWQQVALCEGWAYYREWEMAKNYLAYNSLYKGNWRERPYYPDTYTLFPGKYAGMFYRLKNLGYSFTNLEKMISVYSVSEYCEKLKTLYPSLNSQIDVIKKDYE